MKTVLRKFPKSATFALIALFTLFLQITRAEDLALKITGEVTTPLELTMTQIRAMPATNITATDHDGSTADYVGVQLRTLLTRAGVPQGEALRGPALQLGVLVKAADGYKVLFSLAEFDPAFTDKQILLAYKRNSADLDAKTGPLRLVIPQEKRQGRWVRQVIELEIVRAGPQK